MKTQSMLTATLLVLASAILPAASPSPDGPTVQEVLVFDVGPNMNKFIEITKRARAIAEKYGSTGKPRFWMSAYSGPNTGRVIVTVEYPSLVALAQSAAKVRQSPEWQQLLADTQASSIEMVSDSIAVELNPEM
jgi:hypothetical protein